MRDRNRGLHVAGCAALVLALWSVGSRAAGGGADAPLHLRLDTDLVTPADVAAGPDSRLLDSVDASELRARIDKVRTQVDRMDRENGVRAARLVDRERFASELSKLAATQDRAASALEAAARARATPAAAPAPPASPPAAPAPIAPAAKVAKVANVAIGPVVVPVDALPWLVAGVLGVLVLALLVWVLQLRARAAAHDAATHDAFGPIPPVADEPPPPVSWAAPAVAEPASPEPELSGDDDGTHLGDTADQLFEEVRAEREAPAPEPEAAPAVEVERTVVLSSSPLPAAPAAPAGSSDEAAEPVDWTQTMIRRKAADPDALREVDTLIAFESYEQAKRLLDELVRNNPDNPEYRLRLLHIDSVTGDTAKQEEEEEILRAMMDGPLSETLYRVKEIGRGLMPGNPLFEDPAHAEEAKRILDRHATPIEPPAPEATPATASDDDAARELLDEIFGVKADEEKNGGGA